MHVGRVGFVNAGGWAIKASERRGRSMTASSLPDVEDGIGISRFSVLARDGSDARRGQIHFRNGSVVNTPAFMPVGTMGAVRSLSAEEVEKAGSEIILGNTFHLMLRPGADIVKSHPGRIRGFAGWRERPVLTDSGGFQVGDQTTNKQTKQTKNNNNAHK